MNDNLRTCIAQFLYFPKGCQQFLFFKSCPVLCWRWYRNGWWKGCPVCKSCPLIFSHQPFANSCESFWGGMLNSKAVQDFAFLQSCCTSCHPKTTTISITRKSMDQELICLHTPCFVFSSTTACKCLVPLCKVQHWISGGDSSREGWDSDVVWDLHSLKTAASQEIWKTFPISSSLFAWRFPQEIMPFSTKGVGRDNLRVFGAERTCGELSDGPLIKILDLYLGTKESNFWALMWPELQVDYPSRCDFYFWILVFSDKNLGSALAVYTNQIWICVRRFSDRIPAPLLLTAQKLDVPRVINRTETAYQDVNVAAGNVLGVKVQARLISTQCCSLLLALQPPVSRFFFCGRGNFVGPNWVTPQIQAHFWVKDVGCPSDLWTFATLGCHRQNSESSGWSSSHCLSWSHFRQRTDLLTPETPCPCTMIVVFIIWIKTEMTATHQARNPPRINFQTSRILEKQSVHC